MLRSGNTKSSLAMRHVHEALMMMMTTTSSEKRLYRVRCSGESSAGWGCGGREIVSRKCQLCSISYRWNSRNFPSLERVEAVSPSGLRQGCFKDYSKARYEKGRTRYFALLASRLYRSSVNFVVFGFLRFESHKKVYSRDLRFR